MRPSPLWMVLAVGLGGCASGPRMLLQEPVQGRCEQAKLKGCEDLAEGLVLYIEGQKPAGLAKVKTATAKNLDRPERIKMLTTGLRLLGSAPYVGPYVAKLRPLIDVMAQAADEAIAQGGGSPEEETARPPAAAPAGPEEAAPAPTRTNPYRTGTTIAVGARRAGACKTQGGPATCATVADGPFLVSDVRSSGGCSAALVLLAGDPDAPRWYLVAPPGQPFALSGARLYVPADEPLILAQQGGSSSPPCAVTWSGSRP